MHKEGIAFSAGFPAELNGHAYFGSHGNSPSRLHILHRQFGVASPDFLGLLKEDFDALPRDLLDVSLLHH
jgi:hypothetical protein